MFAGITDLIYSKNQRKAAIQIAQSTHVSIFACWLSGQIDHQQLCLDLRAFAKGETTPDYIGKLVELLTNANGELLAELIQSCVVWANKPHGKTTAKIVMDFYGLRMQGGKTKKAMNNAILQAQKDFAIRAKKETTEHETPFDVCRLIWHNAKSERVLRQPTIAALDAHLKVVKAKSLQNSNAALSELSTRCIIDSIRTNKAQLVTLKDVEELMSKITTDYNPLISTIVLFLREDKSEIARKIECDIQRVILQYHEYIGQNKLLHFANSKIKPKNFMPFHQPKSTQYAQEIIQRALGMEYKLNQLNCENAEACMNTAKKVIKDAIRSYSTVVA